MIDAALYRRLFAELAEIGREPGGWNRMAWGPGEDAAREWFARRGGRARAGAAAGSGRQPLGGRAGRGRRGRSTPSARTSTRSPTAARSTARWASWPAWWRSRPRGGPGGAARPLAVGAMVDEEGPRFGAAIFGSRALCGELDVDEVLARTDHRGQRAARSGRAARRDRRERARRARLPAARGLVDRGARRAGPRAGRRARPARRRHLAGRARALALHACAASPTTPARRSWRGGATRSCRPPAPCWPPTISRAPSRARSRPSGASARCLDRRTRCRARRA